MQKNKQDNPKPLAHKKNKRKITHKNKKEKKPQEKIRDTA